MRTLSDMGKEQLGTELKITAQQMQKYERRTSRISASHLLVINQILDVLKGHFLMVCQKIQ